MPQPSLSAVPARRTLALLSLVAFVPAAGVRSHSPRTATPDTLSSVGRIEGEVLISTALSSRRPRFRIYSDPGPGARPPAREMDEISNVVLYVENAPADDAVPAGGSIAQEGERFVPHVLPVLRGSLVEFPNTDDVFHNVFSLSSAKTFDLGRYPKGNSKSVVFDEPGVIQVFCHIHSDMSAVILVLANPYFTVPASNGHYSISGVPAGDYTVVGWHERIRPVRRTVHVVAGATTRLDFNIPLPSGGESVAHPSPHER